MPPVFGSPSSETVNGTGAAEEIYGGPDTSGLMTGDDIINASGGDDSVFGGDGTDRIFGQDGADILDGGSGNDDIYGIVGNDTSSGGAGTDILAGGTGNDLLFGGEDNDTLDGGEEQDTVSGDAGADQVNGSAGADLLFGGAGNDLLNGGSENDTLTGGAGADVLNGGTGFDFVDFSASAEAVRVTLTSTPLTGGDAAGDVVAGVEGIIGSGRSDVLTGNASANALLGGLGDDNITGNGGNDTLDAGAGSDTVAAGSGDDTILGGSGDDSIAGEAGIDTLDNSALAEGVAVDLGGARVQGDVITGVEIVIGSSGDDTVTGTGAAETLTGGEGDDRLAGAGGVDVLNGGIGNDDASGGAGADLLQGGAGLDTLDGGEGADIISGGDDADVLQGGGGNDSITGGAGDDILRGDADPGTGTSGTFSWAKQGIGTNVGTGFNQDVAGMSVGFGYSSPTRDPTASITADRQYTGGDAQATSGLFLYSTGAGPEVASLTFTSNTAGVSDEVENVAFRINDIDRENGKYIDQVTVRAYDSDGNEVPVALTVGGNDILSGGTVTAGPNSELPQQSEGTLAVEIAGPVARIEVAYASAGGVGERNLYLTDVDFMTRPITPGSDTLDGGDGNDILVGEEGADVLRGGAGDDTITLGAGDTAEGGDGNDRFILSGPEGEASLSGGGGMDVLDFGGAEPVSFKNQGSETVDGVTTFFGTAVFGNGATVSYDGIENIICFTPGTRILTPYGQRPVEDLVPGDAIVTRDEGVQILRWTGSRQVPAVGRFAPVRLMAGAVPGLDAPLLVSPQHRMLVTGATAQLHFATEEVLVPAHHLIDGDRIARVEGGSVTYIHLLFDRHQILFANGAPSESFHPATLGLTALEAEARDELFALFPELRATPEAYGRTARPVLRAFESRILM